MLPELNRYGEVYTTRIQEKNFSGKGVFKPGVVYWEENPEGRVIIDGKRCKILTKSEYDEHYVLVGGKNYHTVKIGNQVWTVENLDYAWDGVLSEVGPDTDLRAVYYEYNESTWGWNGRRCGRLYNVPALRYLDDHPDMLPPGWRIPSTDDFTKLFNYAGIAGDSDSENTDKIRKGDLSWADASWTGTNTTGFSWLPAGMFSPSGTGFKSGGEAAYTWCSDRHPDPSELRNVLATTIGGQGAAMFASGNYYYASVRLVRDANYTVTIGGRKYNTVTIGDKIWLAENLAYVWEGLTRDEAPNGDNPVYIETAFDEGGLFYNERALEYLVNHPELLPEGWRVPTRRDFESLISSTGLTNDPKKLVVPNDYIEAGFPLDFDGTNNYGFNGLPLGSYVGSSLNYNSVVAYWTSTKVTPGDDDSYYYLLRMTKDGFAYPSYTWSNRYNIRLVKDA